MCMEGDAVAVSVISLRQAATSGWDKPGEERQQVGGMIGILRLGLVIVAGAPAALWQFGGINICSWVFADALFFQES